MPILNQEQATARLKELGGWTIDNTGAIARTFTLSGFPQALLFVNAVGLLAEAAGHHPDIVIRWRRVTLSLITHDEGGLTEKDMDLAAQINALKVL